METKIPDTAFIKELTSMELAKFVLPNIIVELFTTILFVEMENLLMVEFADTETRGVRPKLKKVFVETERFAAVFIVPPWILFPTASVTVPKYPLTKEFPVVREPLPEASAVSVFAENKSVI